MSFATTWMELDIIILSEASQLNMWNLKKKIKEANELIQKRETDLQAQKKTYGYQREKGRRDKSGDEINRHTPTVFKTVEQQGLTVQHSQYLVVTYN